MESIVGMARTGRTIPGPASDLVELQSPKGLKHTAIVFHAEVRDHPALKSDVKSFRKFMEEPEVGGIVPLAEADIAGGTYVYATGTIWSVAEIVRAYADLGETCGVRAGLELAYVVAQILEEAAEAAEAHELYNHGSLDPWKIVLRPDGQVAVLGYGLPQVEILDFLDDERRLPKEDSFRYAPPERLEDEGEDLSSDLFSLALVALELMTGRPVYDGLINDIRQQATRAEGTYRLYKWRNLLPDTVREALGRALKYDPDARYPSATDFVYSVHDLLGSPDLDGPSLLDVVKRVKVSAQKGKPLVGGRTAALTKDELAQLASELDDEDEQYVLAPPKRPRPDAEPEPEPEEEEVQRWGKAARPGRRSVSDRKAAPPRQRAEREGGSRDELRRRLRRDRPSRVPPAERSGDKEDLRSSLKARLRDSVRGEEEPRRSRKAERPPEPEPEPEEEPMASDDDLSSSGGAAALLARLRSSAGRRSSGGSEAPPAKAPTPPATDAAPRGPAPTPAPRPPAELRSGSSRVERGTRGDRGNDDKIAVQVAVDGASPRKIRLRVGDSLAESAWRLSQALAAMPTDLSGHLTGWYRLQQNGHWWPGDDTAEALDPARTVELVLVPNRHVRVTIEVEGTEPAVRFQAPVGTAVPAASLVEHLRGFLGLTGEGWGLYVDGRRLDPFQILDDYEPTDGFVVVVKR